MRIMRLQPGERAPETANHIRIYRLPNGKNRWRGTIGLGDSRLEFASENKHPSVDDAEAEGISWARRNGVTELIVGMDDA
jgi:hypothetical protein